MVHGSVILAGNGHKLENSHSHRFPIFKTPEGYAARAGRMIDGVSPPVTNMILNEQTYTRLPHTPEKDPLWILNDLNNTAKHRLIPVTVVGIGIVRAMLGEPVIDVDNADHWNQRFELISVQSPDIVLRHNEVFFSFVDNAGHYDDIRTKLTCAVAFQQAMEIGGNTVSMDAVLRHVYLRVHNIVDSFRPLFI